MDQINMEEVLKHGGDIRHKYRRSVEGKVTVSDGDYVVKWTDRDYPEHLHIGDMRVEPWMVMKRR